MVQTFDSVCIIYLVYHVLSEMHLLSFCRRFVNVGCSATPVEYTANSGTIQSPGFATSTYPDNSTLTVNGA